MCAVAAGSGEDGASTEGFSAWYSQRLHGLLHDMNLLTYTFVLPTCVNAFTAHLEIDSERPADGCWWGAMKYHEVTHESCQEDFLCGSMAWEHPGGHGTFEAKLASLSGGNIIICKIPLANYLLLFEIKCTVYISIMWDHFKGPCFVNFGPMVRVTATCSQANYLAMTAVLLVALQLNNLRLALQPWWVRRSWALERHIQTFYRVAHEEIKMEHKIRAVLHGSQDPNTSPLQDLGLG